MVWQSPTRMSQKVLTSWMRSLHRNKTVAWFCNHYSTNSKAVPSKIYELRIYTNYPKDFKKTVQLFNDYIHLRVKHSKLLGFWTAEIGDSVFQHIHLWEYDSLSHRRQVRNSLLGDIAWQTEFMVQLLPCMKSMTNALLVPTPGSRINIDFKNDPSAVYELLTMKLQDETPPRETSENGDILIGRFQGILGSAKTEYQLWRYPDIDKAFTALWNRSNNHPEEGSSLLLYPAKISPIS